MSEMNVLRLLLCINKNDLGFRIRMNQEFFPSVLFDSFLFGKANECCEAHPTAYQSNTF